MTESERSLLDAGTRYQHLTELRAVWQDGLIALGRIAPEYFSNADDILKRSLTTAIELLDKQVDIMSGYNTQVWDTRRRVDAAHKEIQPADLLPPNEPDATGIS